MNYLEQFYTKYNGETDLAYETYEEIIFKYLPRLIKKALNDNDPTISFQLTIENVRSGLSGELANIILTTFKEEINDKIAIGINKKEFESYIHNIPTKKDSKIPYDDIAPFYNEIWVLDCNTIDLINFYYEELQRGEYDINRAR